MRLSSDSFVEQAPQFDDVVGALLTSTVRWILGPGAVGAAIIGVIVVALAVKSWFDLVKDTHKAAVGVVRVGRLVAARLGEIPAVVIVLNVCLSAVILSLQGVWLYVSWRLSPLLTAWWNFPVWGSWEMQVGRPWASMTGYYTLACGVLLVIAWLILVKDDVLDPVPTLAMIGAAAAAVPALLSIPLLVMLVIGTCIGLFRTTGRPRHGLDHRGSVLVQVREALSGLPRVHRLPGRHRRGGHVLVHRLVGVAGQAIQSNQRAAWLGIARCP